MLNQRRVEFPWRRVNGGSQKTLLDELIMHPQNAEVRRQLWNQEDPARLTQNREAQWDREGTFEGSTRVERLQDSDSRGAENLLQFREAP